MTLDFPGADKLVASLDAAVALGDDRAVTDALRKSLCELICDEEVSLPACVLEPISDHYARRELYTSPEHGYSVIAMTWGPGQGTKIHDHSGMWCVEGVWRGRLEITQYELAERDDVRYRFVPAGTIEAGTGSAGSSAWKAAWPAVLVPAWAAPSKPQTGRSAFARTGRCSRWRN